MSEKNTLSAPSSSKQATKVVQAGIAEDKAYRAVIPPLYLSSTHKMEGLDTISDAPYQYSRVRNPTRDILVDTLAELEGGYSACVTASGMAAITLILQLLKPGDLLLAPYDCYGRAYRLMATLAEKGHFDIEFIDQYDETALNSALQKKPKMVFIETPSNPLMRIADIQAISTAAKAQNPDCLIVCDNTFLSPLLQTPLALGADIVTHSTTKFINGHSDVVGGAVIAKTKGVWEDLDFWANSMGLIGAPFDSYMTLRGLRTLDLRIQKAQDSAIQIARFLEDHPGISHVYYPGLPHHSGHKTAKTQQKGFGSMLSFELNGDGGADKLPAFLATLEIFALAQSLGGTESLINHPASMTHVSMGAEARAKAGVTDTLLRLSVGVEDCTDLIQDLERALQAIKA